MVMRGHITKRGDAWRVHVYLGVDPATAKQRYLTRTVRGTKREAEIVCAQMVAEVAHGDHAVAPSGTVGELLERWMAHAGPDMSPATVTAYRIYLRKWIVPALGSTRLDRLKPAAIDQLYASLRGHLSTGSIRKVHTILRSSLGQAVRWGLIATNPAASASPPKVVRKPIVPPTPNDVARLLEAADACDPEFGLYLRLAAVTGARRGELCALRWTDIDHEEGQLLIERAIVLGPDGLVVKRTKTNRDRRIALDTGTLAALQAHRSAAEARCALGAMKLVKAAYVFSRDVEGRAPWRPDSSATGRFMALRDTVGLPKVRLHDLRHYVATRLLDAGVPVRSVSERLGHASATTTLTIYAAAVPATDRRSAEILGAFLEGE